MIGFCGIVSLAMFIIFNLEYISYFGFLKYISFFGFRDYSFFLGIFISIALVFVKKTNIQNVISIMAGIVYIVYFASCFLYSSMKLSDSSNKELHMLYIIGYILFAISVIAYVIAYFVPNSIIKMILIISKICIVGCIIISIVSSIVFLHITGIIEFYIDIVPIQCGIYIWFYPRSLIKRKPKNISPADRIQSEIDWLDKEFAFGNISQEEYQERKDAIIDNAIK